MKRLRKVVLPTAKEVDETCIRSIFALNTTCKFLSMIKRTEEVALIDSGATCNFIDDKVAKRLGLRQIETTKPIPVYNVDGTKNKRGDILHYTWMRIVMNDKRKLQKFYLMELGGDDILLGYPFLKVFNPKIDWARGQIGSIEVHAPQYQQSFREKVVAL